MKYIDEKLFMPVGMAVVIIGGATTWITSINANVSFAKQMYDDHQRKISVFDDKLDKVNECLARIDGRLIGIESELKRMRR